LSRRAAHARPLSTDPDIDAHEWGLAAAAYRSEVTRTRDVSLGAEDDLSMLVTLALAVQAGVTGASPEARAEHRGRREDPDDEHHPAERASTHWGMEKQGGGRASRQEFDSRGQLTSTIRQMDHDRAASATRYADQGGSGSRPQMDQSKSAA
jgi:hypothetical protein